MVFHLYWLCHFKNYLACLIIFSYRHIPQVAVTDVMKDKAPNALHLWWTDQHISESTNDQHPSTCNLALELENQALVLRIKVLENKKKQKKKQLQVEAVSRFQHLY
jgi:aspartate ammonia-lyase